MSLWKRFRYRLEAWGCLLFEWGLPLLSRRACVTLGRALGALAFRFDARGRAVALGNLACVFGDRFSEAERCALARASYQNFARTMLDLFWARRLTPENFRDWMKLEGFEELRVRLAESKRGSVFMCVHQGNWEWANLGCGFLGFGNTTVAEDFKNPHLTEIFRRRREHSGQILIGQDSSLLRMLRAAKQGGATGMLIDLNLRPTQAATVIEGFGPDGLKMCVPLLHAALAQRAGALLVPVETQPQDFPTAPVGLSRTPRCNFPAMQISPRLRSAAGMPSSRSCARGPRNGSGRTSISAIARATAVRPYPAYAHESGKFEKLRRSQSV